MVRKLVLILGVFFLVTPLLCRGQDTGVNAGRDAGIHERLGDFYLQGGDSASALLEWEKAIRLESRRASCWFKLGSLYYGSGLPEKSLFYFTKGVEISPSDPFGRYDLGLALLSCGKRSRARSEFEEVIRLSPGREYCLYPQIQNNSQSFSRGESPAPGAHFFLGYLYAGEGEHNRAVFELKRSFLPLSFIFSQTDREQRTLAFLDLMAGDIGYSGSPLDVTVLNHSFIEVKDNRGAPFFSRSLSLTLSERGRLIASGEFDTGIAVPPGTTDIFFQGDGVLYGFQEGRDKKEKNRPRAMGRLTLVTFERPWNLSPESPGIYREGSPCGRLRARSTLVAPGYRRTPHISRGSAAGWEIITACGTALAASDSLHEAYLDFSESDEIKLYEDSLKQKEAVIPEIEARSSLASLYLKAGLGEKAEEMLREALLLQPQNSYLHFNLGYCSFQSADLKGAQKELQKALDCLPPGSSWRFYDLLRSRSLLCLGLVKKELGQDRAAAGFLKDSPGGDPETSFEAYLPLSLLLWKEDRKAASLVYLFEFLQATLVPGAGGLDAGILQEGFFELEDDSGRKLHTRKGSFTLNARGEVVTAEGYRTGIHPPGDLSNLAFSETGELLGTDRTGGKQSCGRLRMVEVTGPGKRAGGGFHEAAQVKPLEKALLAPGFTNRQGICVKEEEAWKLLATVTEGSTARQSLIRSALLGRWKDVAAEAETVDWPGGEDFLHWLLCRAYLAEGKLDDALRELQSMQSEDLEPAWCLRETLAAYLEGGGPQEETIARAVLMLEQFRHREKNNPEAAFLLAWLYDLEEKEKKALEEYNRFLAESALRGDLPVRLRIPAARIRGTPDFVLMEILMPGRPGFLAEACARCTTVIRPDKPRTGSGKENRSIEVTGLRREEKILFAHYRKGCILKKSGRLDEAIGEYRTYVRLRGLMSPLTSSFICREIIGAYFEAGLLDEARNELDFIKYDYRFRNKSLVNLFIMLGKAYEGRGEQGKARECYREALKIRETLPPGPREEAQDNGDQGSGIGGREQDRFV